VHETTQLETSDEREEEERGDKGERKGIRSPQQQFLDLPPYETRNVAAEFGRHGMPPPTAWYRYSILFPELKRQR